MAWVLVVFTPETDEVEVFGPWDNVDEANGAAIGKRRMLASAGEEDSVRMAMVPIKPMVYYQPEVLGYKIGDKIYSPDDVTLIR